MYSLEKVIFQICVDSELCTSKCNVHMLDFISIELSEGISVSISFSDSTLSLSPWLYNFSSGFFFLFLSISFANTFFKNVGVP